MTNPLEPPGTLPQPVTNPVAIARCRRISAHLYNRSKAMRNKYFALPVSYRRRVGWGKWAYRHGLYPGNWRNRDMTGWLAKFTT